MKNLIRIMNKYLENLEEQVEEVLGRSPSFDKSIKKEKKLP